MRLLLPIILVACVEKSDSGNDLDPFAEELCQTACEYISDCEVNSPNVEIITDCDWVCAADLSSCDDSTLSRIEVCNTALEQDSCEEPEATAEYWIDCIEVEACVETASN